VLASTPAMLADQARLHEWQSFILVSASLEAVSLRICDGRFCQSRVDSEALIAEVAEYCRKGRGENPSTHCCALVMVGQVAYADTHVVQQAVGQAGGDG